MERPLLSQLLAVILVAAPLASACSTDDRVLFIVNATGNPGLTVLVDGKEVARGLPVAGMTSAGGGTARVAVKPGSHDLVARDVTGRELERHRVTFGKRSFGYLFAPAHVADACFEVRTHAYGNYQGSTAPVPLGPSLTLWEMDHFMDRWMEDAPDKVMVQGGQTGSHERSVVRVPCTAPPAAR